MKAKKSLCFLFSDVRECQSRDAEYIGVKKLYVMSINYIKVCFQNGRGLT